jgi:multidrug efflux pump subunit AcrA (membrane-fusion protein)
MKVVVSAMLLVVAAHVCGGCKERAEAKAERAASAPVPVTLAPARAGPVQRHVDVVGTLYGDEEATVSAKVPGRIVQVSKDVGDAVAPGETLAQIEKTDYDLAVAQKRMAVSAALAKLALSDMPPSDFDLTKVPTVERARLQGANAQAKFERGKRLHEQDPPLMSDQDFADLQTAYEVAKSNYDVELLTARSLLADARARQSELDQETQRLHDTTIKAPTPAPSAPTTRPSTAPAPRAGYSVASRMVSVGEYVREGTALFRLVALDPIKFRSQVPERYLGQVKVGQAVRVSVQAYPGHTFDGTVARISPQVEMSSRTFVVEMLLANTDGRLGPGSFATAQILTRVDPQVTLIPADAIVTFAGVSKVFTVGEGKAVERKIDTGEHVGDGLVEVVSGMEKPEPVVIEGKNRLATGTPVTVSQNRAP